MELLQLRQLKQIDVERNVLNSGLEMVELTRRAYLDRIAQLSLHTKRLDNAHLSQVRQ